MSTNAPKSLKERCEQQLINELSCDPVLRKLFPKRQASSGKPRHPYIAVVATPGREISPQSKLWNVSAAIEFYFDASKGQDGSALDDALRRCDVQMGIAQARGAYGVIRDGEQPMQFVSDTIRKRVYALRLIAG